MKIFELKDSCLNWDEQQNGLKFGDIRNIKDLNKHSLKLTMLALFTLVKC